MIKKELLAFSVLVLFSSLTLASSISPSGNLVRSAASIILNEKPIYVFGAHKPVLGRYDCSSFLKETALRANLASLPRDSRSQFDLFKKTSKVWLRGDRGWQDLRPGDLIFFSGTYRHGHSNPVSHVMIYAGENQMIGAQSSGVGLFDFVPVPPAGSPGSDCRSVYRKSTVYAYARPDWRQVQRITQRRPANPPADYERRPSYQTVAGGSYHKSNSSSDMNWIPSPTASLWRR
jgi:hypothetical protein